MSKELLRVNCPELTDNSVFPIANTGRGADYSPTFYLKNLTPKAKSLAMTLDDITHPIFGNYNHWLIWNIPAMTTIPNQIPAGKIIPSLDNAKQGIGYGYHKYAGPKPPKGKSHVYRFTIYVLDDFIQLPVYARKKQLLKTITPHVLQTDQLTATFE